MHPLNYYTSELAIHDNIVEAARGGIPTLYESWKKQKGIRPFVLSWPSKDIVWNGKVTDRVVAFDAPRNKSRTRSFLLEVKEKTAAYALLYWEQQAQAVVGILESPHGSVSWHIPIQDQTGMRMRTLLKTTTTL